MQVNAQLIQNHMGMTDSHAYKKHIGFQVIESYSQPLEGVVLRHERSTSNRSMSASFYKKGIPCIEFSYVLSADARFLIFDGGRNRIETEIRSGTCGALFNRAFRGICETNPSVPSQVFNVYITPGKITSLLGQDSQRIVEKMITKVNSTGNGLAAPYPIPPAVEVIIHQIINRRFCEAADPLFVQAKIMELLAHEVERYCGPPDKDHCLQPDDIARLQMAKKVMMENMSAPPTLHELARLVGLNQKKIKQGFHELFNTTVFGFLRRYRMEQAMLLFEKDMASVSEVASTVGYANVSHFGATFKSHHGVLPGEYKKSLKKKFLLKETG